MIKRGPARRNVLPSLLAVGVIAACAAFLGGGLFHPAHAAESGFYRVRLRGPSGPVHSVSVDRQGFVWSAGPAGACRFDGLTTRCLDHGPADVVAASMAGDDVWAVLSGGKLRKIFPATPPSAHWQVPGSATGLLVTQDRVWVVGPRGLFVLQKEPQQQNLLAVAAAPGKSIVAVDGGAVVALADGHMVRYDSELRPTSIGRQEVTSPVGSLSSGADGGWLAATPADIWRAHKRNQGFSRVEFSSTSRTSPRSVLETDDGAIWIGTAGGLFHLAAGAKEAVEVKGLPYSSPNFAVTDIASTAAARVWLATPAGLFEVEAQFPSKTLSHAAGDAVTIAFAVAPSRSDGVWFSSADGINFSSHDSLQRYGRAEGLNLPDLRAVAVDNSGDVWAGCLGSGLFKLDPTQKRFLPQPALWSKGVRAILPSRKGGLWLGLSPSGLVWVKDSRAHVLLPAAAKGATEVLDMLEHEDGSLWVALRTGGLAIITTRCCRALRLASRLAGRRAVVFVE